VLVLRRRICEGLLWEEVKSDSSLKEVLSSFLLYPTEDQVLKAPRQPLWVGSLIEEWLTKSSPKHGLGVTGKSPIP